MEALARNVVFVPQSTCFKVFKEEVGITPSQWVGSLNSHI